MLNRLVTITSIITYQYPINFTPCRQILSKLPEVPVRVQFLFYIFLSIRFQTKTIARRWITTVCFISLHGPRTKNIFR